MIAIPLKINVQTRPCQFDIKIKMINFLKKNFAILLAFLLPIILIAVVALSTYIPSLFLSPTHNFIYASCTDGRNYFLYTCETYLQKRYSVVNNRLIANVVDQILDSDNGKIPDVNEIYTARIFLHDTQKNESREITFEEAQTLTLNSLLTSPDGITISGHHDRGNDFFFIFDGGTSSYDYYLTKGNSRSKINLIHNTEYSYRNDFHFIGWIMPGRN